MAEKYPFERFTESAKATLALAQREAELAYHSYVGSEHILLALLQQRATVAGEVLLRLGIELDVTRSHIENILGRNQSIVIEQIIPTARVKKVIELSFEEARRSGHKMVGTEHLLLGLLIEGQGIAAHLLQDMGANLDAVRETLAAVRGEDRVTDDTAATDT